MTGRRLHGRRGLKCRNADIEFFAVCRRLHGRRGLKYRRRFHLRRHEKSPPSRAAWIEIKQRHTNKSGGQCRRLHGRRGLKWLEHGDERLSMRSPPSRAAWIEISRRTRSLKASGSPPSRAAWIEISASLLQSLGGDVAAFTGGVD